MRCAVLVVILLRGAVVLPLLVHPAVAVRGCRHRHRRQQTLACKQRRQARQRGDGHGEQIAPGRDTALRTGLEQAEIVAEDHFRVLEQVAHAGQALGPGHEVFGAHGRANPRQIVSFAEAGLAS